jgi:hypothetical protein
MLLIMWSFTTVLKLRHVVLAVRCPQKWGLRTSAQRAWVGPLKSMRLTGDLLIVGRKKRVLSG